MSDVNWSAPSGVSGSMSSSAGASGVSYPFQSQFSSPGPTRYSPGSAQTLGRFGSYEDYLKAYRKGRPAVYGQFPFFNTAQYVDPSLSGSRAFSSAGQATYTPYTEEQFNQMLRGRAIGTGQSLQGAASSPALDQYRARLQSLLGDPSQIEQDPSYQFIRNQGYGTLERQLNASRMGDSGRALLAAQEFGQGTAKTYLNQLADLYGGGIRSEAAGMAPRLGAESDIFKAYWGGAPWSAQASGSQGLSFTA